MKRREVLAAGAGFALLSLGAEAQTTGTATSAPPAPGAGLGPNLGAGPIQPQNPLELAFISALGNPTMRANFRTLLLSSPVALALTVEGAAAQPLYVDVQGRAPGEPPFHGAALFTSATRLAAVLGPNAPRVVLNGRAALERVRGHNVVLNYRLAPMLTLEAEDVARYLDAPD